ncbi:MAG: 4-(cytidine 5'-diphospho)-2-C-methyl-D-erythritol kinase, partial [Pyrinomonadaceae bacterium]|nr:4-(cytidine 5'-diphospho)-2-C-methyl-D-erythritol kinase [Pyrinomonadaceae bacterium]
HELCTLFQTVSLHDNLTFAESDEISLTCDNQAIPIDETSLVVKTAKILREKYAVKSGAAIHLEKRIPAPGGLGGGSSNAAVTLIGLSKLWNIKTGLAELLEIGGKIGADVPFFLYGGTALGTGRGSEITPVKDLAEKFLLIVTPPVAVSTGEAFARLNAPRLTKFDSKSILNVCRIDAESLSFRQANLKNDFEPSVFAVQPEIRRVKEKLLELGAVQANLSGSGASVFAIFEKEETRQATLKALEVETNWRKFAVATVSRDEYRESLKITG